MFDLAGILEHEYQVGMLLRQIYNASSQNVFTRRRALSFSLHCSRANQPYVEPMSRDVVLAESFSQPKLLYSPNTRNNFYS